MRLKHLELRCIVDHDLNLEIDVSSLSTFKFCGDLMKISFTSLPFIVEATVFQWSYRPYGQEFSIRTWLRNLVHVKEHSVNSWFSQSSYWEEAGGSRPAFALEPPFVELKKGDGQLKTEFLHNVKEIRVHHFFGYKREIEFIKHLLQQAVVLGYKKEIEFIKHLLQQAVVLETLSLTYHRLEFDPEFSDRCNNSPKELVEEEIFSLPRVSSLVHILFH
ncbi:hypothetical protein J1N35_040244 [Gossypium stocksii]|uniref:FBD domain-containing protein n=1 Tax=Gossypium stocksii TaxID=47602 RepID=A0A9D3ZI56_9ROSI|nr:hypothetical protein J1N35_040244 [Gossypium stocksii]